MQRILIVEDDKNLAEGIRLALSNENLDFTISGTIEDARKYLRETYFDLLIMDINLPDGNGLELCKEIRRTNKTAILMLTAKDTELDVVSGLESGADDYITKPFHLMILRARIRALLRRTGEDKKKSYDNPPFLFKFETMEFYKDGKAVELSKTEQKILYILVFNERHIITRERLLEWVWTEGTEFVEDNALSVGIKRLRDKLEDTPSMPRYIKTVYGKGYIWEN